MITELPYLVRDKIIEYCCQETIFELSLINSKYRCLFYSWIIEQEKKKTQLKRQRIEKYLTEVSRLRRWNGDWIIRSDMMSNRGTSGFDFQNEEEFLNHNLNNIKKMNHPDISFFDQLIKISEENRVKSYQSDVGVIMYTQKICFDHQDNLVVMEVDLP